MNLKKLYSALAAVVLVAATMLSAAAATVKSSPDAGEADRARNAQRVRVPLNLAILIQDDLDSRVGNELKVTRDFIRALPKGSRVLVGYVTSGSLQVRQPFTDDLESAAKALRVPVGSNAGAPFNPYVEVRDALKRFPEGGPNRNALLLVSDGLDISRGFDWSSSVHSIDLDRAVKEAKRRNVAVYTFYAPSGSGLTSYDRRAVTFGQSALNRLADETGGEAFFQGTNFVTFDAYFKDFSRTVNRQYASAY